MAPLICLIAAFVIFRVLGVAVPYFGEWPHSLCAALGAVFLLTASAHWGKRRPDLVRMVPRNICSPGLWVSVTGVAEIAIAIGLQIPFLAGWTAGIAILMLCCLFPANIKAAREHLTLLQKPVLPILPRLVLQLIFIGALLAAGWPR
ncbi:MAG: hypothetical protein WCF30_17120 [Terracidiphilus sp.]